MTPKGPTPVQGEGRLRRRLRWLTTKVACSSCCGRGWFNEPTNFIDGGMQRIRCGDCRGSGTRRAP